MGYFTNKYDTTEEFEASKSELLRLKHYVAYDKEDNLIYVKKEDNGIRVIGYTPGENIKLTAKAEYFDSIVADGVELQDGTKSGALTVPTLTNELVQVKFKEGITNLSNCFIDCKITFVNSNLFTSCTEVTNFSYCFQYCAQLTSVPKGLFDNNINATDFSYCFDNCKFEEIPEGLFNNNINVTTFERCFGNNSKLITIPENLFNCLNEVSFSACFTSCFNITAIPENLFSKCSNASSFKSAFSSTNITTIPGNLFAYNTELTEIFGCFMFCRLLTTIPGNLFSNNKKVTSFMMCFLGCTSLISIPENIFDSNTEVTDFYGCFAQCDNLTTIPERLFANNKKVTNFMTCFLGCASLNSSCPIDNDNTPIYNRSENGKEGYAIVGLPTYCFTGCNNMSDYESIPFEWK